MRRGWRILFAVLLLIAVAHTVWAASLQSAFDARLDAIRASGESLELADLNRDPVPPSMNAAPLVRRMVKRNRDDPNRADVIWHDLIDVRPVEPSELAAARAWVERMEPAFGWLEEAANKPSWDFGVDWTSGVATRVDSIPSMNMATQYLKWRAYFAETPEEATACATVLFDLARKMERPSAISCLVRWTVEREACAILERCAVRFGSVAPGGVGDRLIVAEDPDGVRDAFRGERAMCLQLVREWAEGETSPAVALRGATLGDEQSERTALDVLATSPLCTPLAYGDGVRALDMFDDVLTWARLDPWEALEQANGFDERHNHGLPWVFSTLWRVLPTKVFAERCRHLATLRVTDAGLAVLAWREQRGDWPATLADAGEWIDPFTGDPLQYTIEEDGSVRIEAYWWLRFTDDAEKIEFERSIGQDIAWILEAR